MKLDTEGLRHWTVTLSTPVKGHAYRANFTVHVLAPSALRACQRAIEEYPECDVWSIQHSGNAPVLLDKL